MKNKITKYIMFFTLIIAFVGCEKEYEDESRITYFPDFTMAGESEVFLNVGDPYTDPGATAVEAGVNLDVAVSISSEMNGLSEIDPAVADIYTITYSAENSDGFPGTVTRTVYNLPPTGDMVTSIEGLYLGNVQRAPAFEFLDQYTDMAYIFIVKTGDNTYAISDAAGGYYYIGRGYGYDYAAQGTILTANDISANDISSNQAVFPGFGNTCDMSEISVDAATKTISYTATCNFGNGTFYVQLKQIEL